MADPWRYWAVTHADLDIMNPMSSSKLDAVVERMALKRGAEVLDVACGKGELLLRLAQRFQVRGLGIDASPYCNRDAKAAAAERAPRSHLRFVLGDGATVARRRASSFDATCCVGATWVFGGWQGTVEALSRLTRDGGLVVVGHPFWRRPPTAAYLRAERIRRSDFGSRAQDAAVARAAGLRVAGRFTSTKSEFHAYENSTWRAAARFAASHPQDPLSRELLTRREVSRRAYLLDGRECLGWTLWLLRKGG